MCAHHTRVETGGDFFEKNGRLPDKLLATPGDTLCGRFHLRGRP